MSAGTFEIVFVSIIWYYTVYSFGVASIGLQLFSVVTGTTLEKSQPDVPPYITEKKLCSMLLEPLLDHILLLVFCPQPFSPFPNGKDRLGGTIRVDVLLLALCASSG